MLLFEHVTLFAAHTCWLKTEVHFFLHKGRVITCHTKVADRHTYSGFYVQVQPQSAGNCNTFSPWFSLNFPSSTLQYVFTSYHTGHSLVHPSVRPSIQVYLCVVQQCYSKMLLQRPKCVCTVWGPLDLPLCSSSIDPWGISKADSIGGDKSRQDMNTVDSCWEASVRCGDLFPP